MKSILFISAILLTLQACGDSRNNTTPTTSLTLPAETTVKTPQPHPKDQDALYQRTAFALGAEETDLTITAIKKEGFRIDFEVNHAQKDYRCYLGIMTGKTYSDAICVPKNGGAIVNPNNNPLLK